MCSRLTKGFIEYQQKFFSSIVNEYYELGRKVTQLFGDVTNVLSESQVFINM